MLFCIMARLDSVSLCLHHDDALTSQAHIWFENVIEHMPKVKEHLNQGSEIIKCVELE